MKSGRAECLAGDWRIAKPWWDFWERRRLATWFAKYELVPPYAAHIKLVLVRHVLDASLHLSAG